MIFYDISLYKTHFVILMMTIFAYGLIYDECCTPLVLAISFYVFLCIVIKLLASVIRPSIGDTLPKFLGKFYS